jgi:hypothetical protein
MYISGWCSICHSGSMSSGEGQAEQEPEQQQHQDKPPLAPVRQEGDLGYEPLSSVPGCTSPLQHQGSAHNPPEPPGQHDRAAGYATPSQGQPLRPPAPSGQTHSSAHGAAAQAPQPTGSGKTLKRKHDSTPAGSEQQQAVSGRDVQGLHDTGPTTCKYWPQARQHTNRQQAPGVPAQRRRLAAGPHIVQGEEWERTPW